MRRAAFFLLVLLLVLECSRRSDPPPAGADTAQVATGTPVVVAAVTRASLTVAVGGPGRTDALRQLRVRAPFIGTLVLLAVADGDRVERDQVIGAVVSRNSEAALAGARIMRDAARTPLQQDDARRALALAQQGLVRRALRAPEAGVVVSHAATEGDLVNEGDEILSIAAAGSVVFVAQITQSELPPIHPGQRATIELPARSTPVAGVVHGVLPSASSADVTAPVRIDFVGSRAPVTLGLFGTARIVVGDVRDALVVPAAAVLRDDAYGTSRLALVTTDGRVRWVAVTPGITQGGLVQIASPLAVGERVIVAGQGGLADGAPVQVMR